MQPEIQANTLLEQGIRAMRDGDPRTAAGAFGVAVQLAPEASEPRYHLGQALLASGDHDGAGEAFRAVLDRHPGHGRALVSVANLALAQERPAEAVAAYDRALARMPHLGEAHHNRGIALVQLGRLDEAVRAFGAAVEADPGVDDFHGSWLRSMRDGGVAPLPAYADLARRVPTAPLVHAYLAELAWAAGDRQAAALAAERAVAVSPNDVQLRRRAVSLLMGCGRARSAVVHAERLVGMAPEDPLHHVLLGNAYQLVGADRTARAAYESALAIDPGYLPAGSGLAGLLVQEGLVDEAMVVIERLRDQAGDDSEILLGLARAHERRREGDRARQVLAPLFEQESPPPGLALTYALLAEDTPSREQAAVLAERALAATPEPLTRRSLEFTLGRLYDKLGRYDEAFRHYEQGNLLRAARYDRAASEALFDRVIEVFSPERFASLPRATVRSLRPVFIVGMPRSGTSLAEQILDRHPAVTGGGELSTLADAIGGLSRARSTSLHFPEILLQADPSDLDFVARAYLQALDAIDAEALRVTDKMPHNFLRVGLVALAFPGARIVHCQRDPIDNALSIYFQDFAHTHDYAYDLGDIVHHRQQYERVMAHWRSLGIDMFELPYEDLVADQEPWTRRLLDHVGLPWDDACLSFHQSTRQVRTASFQQVREPLYKRSAGRWQHYENHIGPLLAAFGRRP